MKVSVKRIKCFLTGGCKFRSTDTVAKCDNKTKTVTITETCCKCGKQYSFTATYKQFGMPDWSYNNDLC